MVKLERAVIVNRDTQVSNTAVYKKDLPKSGCYSAIDIGIRVTNGGTSNVNGDIIDSINHIGLLVNGNEYRHWITGQELFRYHWLKRGQPLAYTFTEILSEVQEVWFRLYFGRDIGDKQFGLDLSKFDNVQVVIDYTLANINAVGATGPLTGTFAPTIIAHQFPIAQRPSFQGMLGCREFYSITAPGAGENIQNMPSANPLYELALFGIIDNVQEGTGCTSIRIGKDNFASTFLNDMWYNLQPIQNEFVDMNTERVKMFLADAATRDLHIANLRKGLLTPTLFTAPT